ncbi:hypothetical protein A11A3_15841 [Alcanivorax hongdengensis A-11-3]|uniref:DUF4399 domain-containing protein n=1 Tax=Alcanivorax hongdengensis A-11-3 TaxID=1177179 RepID=L0WA85_9GAMM|nr:DUF4399 domain-containing protein [Alcanivorax hongdengensis]EKF72992.1 hypothetical protein A11A3_15841 [Alcanivorax hongdengensis A-11-3]
MRIPFQRSALIALVAGTALLQACSDNTDTPNTDAAPMAQDTMTSQPAAPAEAASSEASGITRTPAPQGASVFIVSPADGATVSSPVKVEFGIEGMQLAPAGTDKPDTGHHHLLVDLDTLPAMDMPLPSNDHVIHFGKAQTSTELELAPGKHTLQLLLGDYRHVPFDPPIMSEKITITVK